MLTLVTLNRKAVGLPVPSWPVAAWCWGVVPCCGCWVLGADPPTLLPPSSLSGRPDTCCSSVTYALVIHLKEGPRLLFFPERRKMLEALLMASEYEEYTMFLIDSEANNSESHKAALSSEGAGICEDRFFPGKQPTWQESWLAHHRVSEAARVSVRYMPWSFYLQGSPGEFHFSKSFLIHLICQKLPLFFPSHK